MNNRASGTNRTRECCCLANIVNYASGGVALEVGAIAACHYHPTDHKLASSSSTTHTPVRVSGAKSEESTAEQVAVTGSTAGSSLPPPAVSSCALVAAAAAAALAPQTYTKMFIFSIPGGGGGGEDEQQQEVMSTNARQRMRGERSKCLSAGMSLPTRQELTGAMLLPSWSSIARSLSIN